MRCGVWFHETIGQDRIDTHQEVIGIVVANTCHIIIERQEKDNT